MTIGLITFVAVVFLDVLGLLLDYLQLCCGGTTISGYVWATPLLGVPILLVQFSGVVGLAWHFYGPR